MRSNFAAKHYTENVYSRVHYKTEAKLVYFLGGQGDKNLIEMPLCMITTYLYVQCVQFMYCIAGLLFDVASLFLQHSTRHLLAVSIHSSLVFSYIKEKNMYNKL